MSASQKKAQEAKRKRWNRRVPGGLQPDLFGGTTAPSEKAWRHDRVTHFIDGDADSLTIGNESLCAYLKRIGMEWVTLVQEVVREIDYSAFLKRYSRNGRPPYAPAAMLGLYLYGTMTGRDSLRALETLAQTDVGGMYVCGGICPDHASIGRFINQNSDLLAESVFENLTASVLKRLGGNAKVLAGDGSVFHAAASRRSTIKREAARLAATEAEAAAAAAPGDSDAASAAEQAAAVSAAAEARAAAQARAGKGKTVTQVSTTEPEAAVLKDKEGLTRPAYNGSLMVNEQRVIVAQHVAPVNELESVAPMLEQAMRVAPDAAVDGLLLDGSYSRGPVLELAVEKNLNLLAPVKNDRRAAEADSETGSSARASVDNQKVFPKSEFRYDSDKDQYTCPAGQILKRSGKGTDSRRGHDFVVYSSTRSACRACPLKNQCITKDGRRRLHRYSTDDAREALRDVMAQPRARLVWDKRKGMVEPVFSELRGAQRFNRFRRFGLDAVRVEFALHACAHNLRRLVCLTARAAREGAQAIAALYGVLYAILASLLRRAVPRRHRANGVAIAITHPGAPGGLMVA